MKNSIAIVDDSETVRKICEVCLHRAGYKKVYTFSDGIAFLQWLTIPEATVPALMVVDVNIPTMDGYTLIRHLKANSAFAETMFIILTGRSGMLDRLKGRLSGAHIYLTKPFRTDEVLTAVRSCLGPSHDEQTTEHMLGVAQR